MADEDDQNSAKISLLPKLEASLAALLASVAAYIFAYFWLRSYLERFQIDSTLVQIDLQTVIVAGSTFLGGLGAAWGIYAGLPAAIGRILLGLFFSFRATLFPAMLFLIVFVPLGFNWFSVITGTLMLIFLLFESLTLRSEVKEKGSISAAFESTMHRYLDYNKHTFDGSISKMIGDSYLNLFLLLALVPYVLGTFSGEYIAGRKSTFLTYSNAATDYLVVYSQANVLLLAEYEKGQGKEIYLTGKSRMLEISGSQAIDFSSTGRVSIIAKEVTKKWVTLPEFLRSVFADVPTERRP